MSKKKEEQARREALQQQISRIKLPRGKQTFGIVEQVAAHAQVKEEIKSMEPEPDPITIIIPTYNRPSILDKTIQNLLQNLEYEGRMHFLIGDDSEHPDAQAANDNLQNHFIDVVVGPGRGLGANLNMLLDTAKTDIVLQMDEDHWLATPLGITQYVKDLRNPNFNMGWVRLFLGEEEDVYSLETYYKFKAASYGPYWFVDAGSPTLYLASNRPHLKKIDMHKKHFGWYPEGKKLGHTEEGFCHQYKTTKKHQRWHETPWVTIPMFGLSISQWKHVGDSWQKRGK